MKVRFKYVVSGAVVIDVPREVADKIDISDVPIETADLPHGVEDDLMAQLFATVGDHGIEIVEIELLPESA